jgi:hypothetical protein
MTGALPIESLYLSSKLSHPASVRWHLLHYRGSMYYLLPHSSCDIYGFTWYFVAYKDILCHPVIFVFFERAFASFKRSSGIGSLLSEGDSRGILCLAECSPGNRSLLWGYTLVHLQIVHVVLVLLREIHVVFATFEKVYFLWFPYRGFTSYGFPNRGVHVELVPLQRVYVLLPYIGFIWYLLLYRLFPWYLLPYRWLTWYWLPYKGCTWYLLHDRERSWYLLLYRIHVVFAILNLLSFGNSGCILDHIKKAHLALSLCKKSFNKNLTSIYPC